MTVTIGRREFLAALGGAVAAWPLAAHAQQPTMAMVGFLDAASAGERSQAVAAFRKGLAESGYQEGKNVAMQFRWAQNQYDQASVGSRSGSPPRGRDCRDGRTCGACGKGSECDNSNRLPVSSRPNRGWACCQP